MNKPLRILHLEDDRDYFELVKAMLEEAGLSIEMVHVCNLAEFTEALERGTFDLILGDYKLPTCTGLEALATARQKCPDTPFLLVSGTIGERAAIESLRCGATDYVLKQWPERLVPTVRRAVEEAQERAQRKRAEAQMRLQSAALEAAANAILLANREGTVLWVNPAFTRLTGYAVEEIVGQNPRLLKSGKQDQAFYKKLWDTILAGQVWRAEMVNRRKDGSFYAEENTITPVRSEQGEITHFIAVKQDITARQELESDLRQAQKMEAIGKLAGGVAHDFNNILTVIAGHASLLSRGGSLSTGGASSAEQIMRAAERAAGLTRQLLAFSRRQLLQPRLLNLNDVVGNLSKMLERILGEDVTLELTYSPQPALVEADAGMMDQVLMNLAVNARDAMPKGGRLGVKVSVEEIGAAQVAMNAEGRPGRFVCLSVVDNGCGIPPENLPRIFEPFFTTKEVGKGTGLGLSTVYGIVKQHGGWVQVESAVDKGTSFRVYLPVSAGSALPAEGDAAKPSARGGRETILVVEDEGPVRELTCQYLAGRGYQTLQAASGAQALEVWRQHKGRIDLLLTDLVMPDQMNGWELAETLWSERPELKVIFTTGYGMDVAGKEFVLRSGKQLLQKPYSPQELAQVVRDCLDGRGAATGSKSSASRPSAR